MIEQIEHDVINQELHSKIVKRLSAVGILGNIILSAFKLAAGILGRSGAMVSDAIHSLSDVAATAIASVGVILANRKADQDHPYGHERFESVAAFVLGVILLLTAVFIGKAGLENIFTSSQLETPRPIALVAAVVSIITKEFMFWYTRYYAKLLNSAAFMADAWHHRSDAFSSIGSLIGVGGAILGYKILDPIASVIICAIILKIAVTTIKDALSQLLDTSCGEKYNNKLRGFINSQYGVIKTNMLHSRQFGNRVYIDLEIEVDRDMPLYQAHAIAENVHHNLERAYPNIKHVMIHVNPSEPTRLGSEQ